MHFCEIITELNKPLDTMIRVRLNKAEQQVNISVKCEIAPSLQKEFNLNRSLDEPISITFQKLFAHFSKHNKIKNSSSNRKNLKV